MRMFTTVLFLTVAFSAGGCSNGPTKDDTDVTDTDTDTTPVDTDVADTDVADAPTCEKWCIRVTDACTADVAQFESENACIAFCEASGIAPGTEGDASGNTIGCRNYHADFAYAGDATAKATHCPHAGAFGGGVCGDEAETFCAIDLHVCNGANAAYASESACVTASGSWAPGTPGDSAGDSLACREYHLGVATSNPAAHCPHTADDGGGVCVSP